MATAEKPEPETIGAQVSPELKRRARMAAAREDKTISDWLRGVLKDATEDAE